MKKILSIVSRSEVGLSIEDRRLFEQKTAKVSGHFYDIKRGSDGMFHCKYLPSSSTESS